MAAHLSISHICYNISQELVSIVTGGQGMRVESRALVAGYGWGLRGGRGLNSRAIPRMDKAWYGI
jgi:hypothetical protein